MHVPRLKKVKPFQVLTQKEPMKLEKIWIVNQNLSSIWLSVLNVQECMLGNQNGLSKLGIAIIKGKLRTIMEVWDSISSILIVPLKTITG